MHLGAGLLRRNVAASLVGQLLPLAAAVSALPPVLSSLGEQRFAILALAWAVLGLSGVLDLAVGRALTKLVAERLGTDGEHGLPPLIATGLYLSTGLGVAAGLALAAGTPWIVDGALKVPADLRTEALSAFYWLSAAVPASIASTALRGVLEAHQRFGRIAAVRAPAGVLVFVMPVIVLRLGHGLPAVIASLVAVRWLALIALLILVLRLEPRAAAARPTLFDARSMLSLGGWMTVSNVIAPVLLYADRFVLASAVSLVAVTHYATPFEVVSRMAVIPAAIMAVLFPALSQALTSSHDAALRLYRRASLAIAAAMVVPVLLVAVGARPLLTLWLGPSMAAASSTATSILAIGALAHALAQPPFNLLQAAGRPDLTARLHLVEAPIYLAYLWWLTTAYGVVGTAVAWSIRVTLSQTALRWLAHRAVIAPRQRSEPA